MSARQAKPTPESDPLRERVAEVLDLMRPSIQADGGDVEIVAVSNGIVDVRFHGACVGCPSASMTLQTGIAQLMRERIPEIREVRAVK